jgi:hypothetical protein
MSKLLLCALVFFATAAVAVWRGPDLAGMDPAVAPGNAAPYLPVNLESPQLTGPLKS